MAIERPQDFAIMFGVFAIVVAWGGILLSDVQNDGVTQDTTFISNVRGYYNSSTGLKGVSDGVATTLSEGDEGEQTEDSFLVRAGRGLLKLGGSFKTMESATNEAAGEVGIPEEFIAISFAVLIIIFAVTLYTWWRGK